MGIFLIVLFKIFFSKSSNLIWPYNIYTFRNNIMKSIFLTRFINRLRDLFFVREIFYICFVIFKAVLLEYNYYYSEIFYMVS